MSVARTERRNAYVVGEADSGSRSGDDEAVADGEDVKRIVKTLRSPVA